MPDSEHSRIVTALVANANGDIFDLDGYGAVGADGTVLAPLTADATDRLPFGSELMYLPDRVPMLYDPDADCVVPMAENPYAPGAPIFPVAAFNSPGYLVTHTSAYEEAPDAQFLPLFSYGAVGWYDGDFRSAAIQVDSEPRQDLRQMPLEAVRQGVARMQAQLPGNRLREHLEHCALSYGCPAGKNFFLGRYEAPLPTATTCNARCLGCLSMQTDSQIPCSQNRIEFTPEPAEIADLALAHIHRVSNSVVSFGQGCEGDPLMTAEVIAAAIGRIRAATDAGTINMNTNGSLPDGIAKLIDAGLDSLRISMNSIRPEPYHAYFRPRGYGFDDVRQSIVTALQKGAHVAINYLNCPGFTDTPQEVDALDTFLDAHPVDMIQWRNLNFDPKRYVQMMNDATSHGLPMGMSTTLECIRSRHPHLRHGYFNPPKETFASTAARGIGPSIR